MASSITIKINKSQLCFRQINSKGERGGSVCLTDVGPQQSRRAPELHLLKLLSLFANEMPNQLALMGARAESWFS